VLVIVGLAVLWYLHANRRWITTTGRVMAEEVHISSPLKGRITYINVREGQRVSSGQLLAKISDEEIQAQIQRARAKLQSLEERYKKVLSAGVDPRYRTRVQEARRDLEITLERLKKVRAEMELAALNLKHRRESLERARRLYLLGAASRLQLLNAVEAKERAQIDLKVAQMAMGSAEASVRGARKVLESAKEALQYAERRHMEELASIRGAIKEAESEVQRLIARLKDTEILSPTEGVVLWVAKKEGEVVDHRDIIMSIGMEASLWIEAYVKASHLPKILNGNRAWVELQGGPKGRIAARVEGIILPQAQPSSLPRVGPQIARTPSQLSKFMHRVKILLDDPAPPGIRPQMVVKVWIEL
jgi:HlyD family secretion protein